MIRLPWFTSPVCACRMGMSFTRGGCGAFCVVLHYCLTGTPPTQVRMGSENCRVPDTSASPPDQRELSGGLSAQLGPRYPGHQGRRALDGQATGLHDHPTGGPVTWITGSVCPMWTVPSGLSYVEWSLSHVDNQSRSLILLAGSSLAPLAGPVDHGAGRLVLDHCPGWVGLQPPSQSMASISIYLAHLQCLCPPLPCVECGQATSKIPSSPIGIGGNSSCMLPWGPYACWRERALCMLAWSRAEPGTLNLVSMDPVGHPEVTDEMLAESAGRARWLILHRYEQIWKTCEPHVNGSRLEEQGSPPDPRWAEIGVRVLDRMARLQRLDKPVAASGDDEDLISEEDTRRAVLASLEALGG